MRQITKQTVSKRMGVSNKISALETVFPKSQQTAACHVSILVGNENKQAGDDQHNSKQHRGRKEESLRTGQFLKHLKCNMINNINNFGLTRVTINITE